MGSRIVVIVLWAAIVAASATLATPGRARRPVPRFEVAPSEPRALAAPSSRDPIVRLTPGAPCEQVCVGTAFAIDDRGHWLTAQHVVRDCGNIAIMVGPGCGVAAVPVVSHPRADVVVLATEPRGRALSRGERRLFEGQDGFHVGFPHGEPGDVHGTLMGRVNVRGMHTREPGIMWAEVARDPDDDQPLGGISGGPVLDARGGVIGVAIAASPRRGRVTSAAPESIDEILNGAGLALAESGPDEAIAGANYSAAGRRLRERLSVAKVLCW